MLTKNVGKLDRMVRVALGLSLLVAYFAFPESAIRWLFLIGIIPLVTGLVSFCPLYSVLGMSTCPQRS